MPYKEGKQEKGDLMGAPKTGEWVKQPDGAYAFFKKAEEAAKDEEKNSERVSQLKDEIDEITEEDTPHKSPLNRESPKRKRLKRPEHLFEKKESPEVNSLRLEIEREEAELEEIKKKIKALAKKMSWMEILGVIGDISLSLGTALTIGVALPPAGQEPSPSEKRKRIEEYKENRKEVREKKVKIKRLKKRLIAFEMKDDK